jgi:hypothetical protein
MTKFSVPLIKHRSNASLTGCLALPKDDWNSWLPCHYLCIVRISSWTWNCSVGNGRTLGSHGHGWLLTVALTPKTMSVVILRRSFWMQHLPIREESAFGSTYYPALSGEEVFFHLWWEWCCQPPAVVCLQPAPDSQEPALWIDDKFYLATGALDSTMIFCIVLYCAPRTTCFYFT